MGVQAETEAVDRTVDRAVDRNERERGVDTDRFPPLLREEPVGALDELLDHRPVFRRRRHGYDRLQVDNYVTWAESELVSARRYADHLLARYGECAAQLELARRESAAPHREVDLTAVSDRLGELLRLAADEAAEVTAAGVDEAERIVGEARQEAERWEQVSRAVGAVGAPDSQATARRTFEERSRALNPLHVTAMARNLTVAQSFANF